MTDEYERERLRQQAVKLSFFKAARSITGVTPAWGALTGIRPGKLAARLLEQGKTPRARSDRVLRRHLLRLAGPAAAWRVETGPGGPAGQGGPAPGGHLPVYRHPLLPHPLRLLQLCVPVGGKVLRADGAVSGGAVRGRSRDAAQMVQDTGLRIKSFYMGGGTPTTLSARQMDRLLTHLNRSFDLSGCAEYCIEAGRPDTIDPGKAAGAAGPRGRPHQRQSPVPGGHRAPGHRPPPHRRRTLRTTMAPGRLHGLPPCEHGPDRRTACRHAGGLPPDPGQVPDLRRGQHHRPHPEPEKGQPHPAGGAAHPLGGGRGRRCWTTPTPPCAAAGFSPYYLYRQKYMSGSFENVGWCISGAEGLYNIYIMEELHSILSLGAGGSTKMVDPVHEPHRAGVPPQVPHGVHPASREDCRESGGLPGIP